MGNTKNLKVITRCLSMKDEEFVLVSLETEKLGIMYGTIPYSELNEKGCMKRELNGLEMCLSDTIPHAIEMREDEIITRNMSEADAIEYFRNKLCRA